MLCVLHFEGEVGVKVTALLLFCCRLCLCSDEGHPYRLGRSSLVSTAQTYVNSKDKQQKVIYYLM